MTPLALDLPGVPSALLEDLRLAAQDAGVSRLALVGGAVRDALLHYQHGYPWLGVPDLDLVVEGHAEHLAAALRERCGPKRLSRCLVHPAFGTVELCLDGQPLDLATARAEIYPAPGRNPAVTPGSLQADLKRRDFTINAMALDLISGELIDPFGGCVHLEARQLVFLHQNSVSDDPTRLIRAARYGARLGFGLDPSSLEQLNNTIAAWPWAWRFGDPPAQAPPALATRCRMELDRLFANEPWEQALHRLERWGALPLIDPALQSDPTWRRRLHWAVRLGLPLLPAWLAGVSDPLATARRLQIPGQHQQWLQQLLELRVWLQTSAPSDQAAPSRWTLALESFGCQPEVVALLICDRPAQWRFLLRWWGRWRHCLSPITARQLLAEGWQPGPDLGAELKRRRLAVIDQGR